MAKVCQEKLLSILGRVLPTSSIDKIFEKKNFPKKEIGPIFFLPSPLESRIEYGMLHVQLQLRNK